jgi:hypothetical protein
MNKITVILAAPMRGEELTVASAYRKYRTTELRRYVSVLKKRGFKICDEWRYDVVTDEKWKEYFMMRKDLQSNINIFNRCYKNELLSDEKKKKLTRNRFFVSDN